VRKQHNGIKKLYEQGLRGATASVEQVLDLFDTIEALHAENEQLQAQVTRVREALRKASARDRVNWFECDRCGNIRDALAEINKALGGKEDAGKK
jgi:cell division protein FtsB